MLSILTLALIPGILANPLYARQNATTTSSNGTSTALPPAQVTIYPATSAGQGITLAGTRNAVLKTDQYLGIPFAQPPVKDLRLTPPQPAIWNTTSFNATKQPPACLQDPTGMSGAYGAYGVSEDCLYLNVFSPAGATAQTAWLPVVVWIYGGAFNSGAASIYNGTGIIAQGQLTGKPVIVVAVNYRVGILGFGYGDAIASNGAANLGLKDQIAALQWVKENIWAFGGDPDRVTVVGESAGAISIALMYLQKDIDLFRGAIMESGAPSTAPIGPTNSTWQAPYDAVVTLLNCTSKNATSYQASNQSSFDCLKAAPADAILKAQLQVQNQSYGAFIWAPSIDGDIIPDSPHSLLQRGEFARIPFISGNNKDEGTLFTPATLNNETQLGLFVYALEPRDPPLSVVQNLLQTYTNVPALGSPYDTGNETFGLSPVYKQAASILGDAQFQSQRRYFLQQAMNYGLTQVWTYQFEQIAPGAAPRLGVSHGSEVFYVFAAPQLGGNYTASDKALSLSMVDYWLSFATNLDPSAQNLPNATYWPSYGSDANMLRLLGGNITVFKDDFRPQMSFFTDQPEAFNMRKRSDRGVSFL